MSPKSQVRVAHHVDAQRTVYTYAYLRMAARHALKDGAARKTGALYEWMTANTFAAFSLEAYLNHLGPRRFRCWEEIERLSVESKLSLLLENLEQQPDFSKRPFQTVKDLLRFRNQVAHGRTEHVAETSIQKLFSGASVRLPRTDWEALCSRPVAERFVADCGAVIKQLHEWAGLDTTFLWSSAQGGAVSAAVDPFAPSEKTVKQPRSKKGVA